MQSKISNALMDVALSQKAVRWLALPVIALLFSVSNPVHAQPYVNVTIGGAIAPGVYGQIALGNNPPPPVINPQPVIIGQPIHGAAPVYFYVPPEHQRDWARYCGNYRACGHPVHFVQVDARNRWWEHRNEHLRGAEHYYHQAESRHERHEDRGRGEGRERR